jgi:hypothetical protein
MRVRFRFIAIALVATCGIVAAVLVTPFGCGSVGGHWASHWGKCVTPLCFYFGNCGTWLNPPTPCGQIREGASMARVYFLLGNPSRTDASTASWYFGKPETWEARASFEAGHLAKMSCADHGI